MHTDSASYERFMGRWSRAIAPSLVDFAEIAADHRVLDVGSGTGSLAAAVLDRAPAAHVIGIDLATAYLVEARTKLGGERASFEEGDVQRLRFADSSFDSTLSLLVFNFIPDRDLALDEMIRVTRPGGVIAAAVWDYGEGMQMLRVFWDEAVALDPAIAPKDERHMPLCRPGELAALWRAHGLQNVQESALTVEQSFASFDDYWAPFLAGQGPAGSYVASLADDDRRAVALRVRERVLGGPDHDEAFMLRARAWAVKATVPSR